MNFFKELMVLLLRSFVYQKAANRLRKKGVLVYLRTLQALRKGLAGSIFLFLFLQLMLFGFIGTIVIGVFLLPQETETKLWILFGVFGAFFALPFISLLVLFSERVWYKLSGAEQMVADLNKPE